MVVNFRGFIKLFLGYFYNGFGIWGDEYGEIIYWNVLWFYFEIIFWDIGLYNIKSIGFC